MKPTKPDHIAQSAWDDVDSPVLTEAKMAGMRPLAEVDPELAAWAKRGRGQRGKQKAPTKIAMALRLDPDVLDAYKSTGKGWQSRMNETLRKGAESIRISRS